MPHSKFSSPFNSSNQTSTLSPKENNVHFQNIYNWLTLPKPATNFSKHQKHGLDQEILTIQQP
jgi:hypothetical protein